MFFIHSTVLVSFMRARGTAGTERRRVTKLAFGCHTPPPRIARHTYPTLALSEIPAHGFVVPDFRSASPPETHLRDVRSFPTDNVLLYDRCERPVHGRLAEIIRCTDELRNQTQDPFHFGTLPSFHRSRSQHLTQGNCRPHCGPYGFEALPL